MIKPLRSYWKGAVFRSRIEARWAVFFDVIKLRWEYEPEGFELDNGTWYLPDFWLPEMRKWVEVKPESGATDTEKARIEGLVIGSGHACLLLCGAPWHEVYEECGFDPGLPWKTEWWGMEFSKQYTIDRRDGAPRMFCTDIDDEVCDDPWVEAAMQIARHMDLKEPGAGHHLLTGWDDIEDVL